MHAHSRPPAVSGRFYPGRPAQLAETVDELLDAAPLPARPGASMAVPQAVPKALIAPHAGYVYSGPIAASAYVHLRAAAARIHRVVLLGPAHRVYVEGVALPAASRFTTPLGALEVDAELAARVAALPFVVHSDEAHALEHALEVQLPFLQRVLDHFTILPLVVGAASPTQVAALLEQVWGGPETLIVISSDLSHYHGYDQARRLDADTAAQIVANHGPGIDPKRACGARCIDGLLELGRRRPLDIELLDLRSSGDTAGPRDQVVGYAAFCVHEYEHEHEVLP
ncbi:AmmeMemoRadiSam system protein B [Pseudenhygromyxa sp. WMMC2535]|uniref:AmmeMemoRadiSam system protein B n=1 Tax=Pseudenhygromyxa sp. WMMC2535 TaxID=2712867 RepID=UPI0031F7A596